MTQPLQPDFEAQWRMWQQALIARRKELGLTQTQAGELIGVGQSTVQYWESVRCVNMPVPNLLRVCAAYSIEMQMLLLEPGVSPVRYDGEPRKVTVVQRPTTELFSDGLVASEQVVEL